MKLSKLLITGAGSRLGYRLIEKAEGRFEWTGTDITARPHIRKCDITSKDEVASLFKDSRPDYVIHTAALTDVDGCESNQNAARAVNVAGTENVALACKKFNSRLIYISTDYVFDGASGPYDESAAPRPINYYGLTKLEGEKCARAVCADAVILRTCVPYDWNPDCPPNFLMWLVEKLKASSGGLSIVKDQWNTPTYNPHLAETLLLLCGKWQPGIFHASGSQFISRYDFALAVCDIFGFDKNRLSPTDTSSFKQIAPRPLRAGFKVGKIEDHLGIKMLDIKDGLTHARRSYES